VGHGPVLNDGALMVAAAVEGFGLAHVMEDMVAAPVASGALVRVLEDWCDPFPGYYLYYPSRRQPTQAFSLFLDAMRRGQPDGRGPRARARSHAR
jgi:DNA-binding transcriptional LysR family regulator